MPHFYGTTHSRERRELRPVRNIIRREPSHEEIAYLAAVGLLPSPSTCGKMNQIQWLRLRPARSSSRTVW